MTGKSITHSIAVVLFGVAVPLVLLFQAYVSLGSLRKEFAASVSSTEVVDMFAKARPLLRSANDFSLYSVMAAEHTNRAVVTNKQVMKVAVMQIGFAVVSLGLMFVILGINDGGGSAVVGGSGLTFDFRTGSTGALVFVIGAAMATAGGVLKNDYQTVPVPTFAGTTGGDALYAQAQSAYAECSKLGDTVAQECFFKVFSQIRTPSQ